MVIRYAFCGKNSMLAGISKLKYLVLFFAFTSCVNIPHDKKKVASPVAPVINKKPKLLSDTTNRLDGRPRTLKLEFISIGCACASWLNSKDENVLNHGNMDSLMFIEPANPRLELSNKFDPENDYIIVHGQFYIKEDYPKGATEGGEEHLEKARVFRYNKIRIVKKQALKI